MPYVYLCIVFTEPQNRFCSETRIYEKQTQCQSFVHTQQYKKKNTNQSQTILGYVYEPTPLRNLWKKNASQEVKNANIQTN